MVFRRDNYAFSVVTQLAGAVLIRDDNGKKTLTNVAEDVVADCYVNGLIPDTTRLFYVDSMDSIDEMIHDGPMFVKFQAGTEGYSLDELEEASYELD